jgi:hypothetical protein
MVVSVEGEGEKEPQLIRPHIIESCVYLLRCGRSEEEVWEKGGKKARV